MKLIKYIAASLLIANVSSCQKIDYQNENCNERQILWVSSDSQMGLATMPDKSALNIDNTIYLTVFPGTDLTSLSVDMALSPQATVSPLASVPQDFSRGPVVYTVTSESGLEREFQLSISEYYEVIEGEWSVAKVEVTSAMDTEYGLDRWPAPAMGQRANEDVLNKSDQAWDGVAYNVPYDGVELDNVYTFDLTSVNEDGDTYGAFRVNAGADDNTATRSIIADFLEDIAYLGGGSSVYNYPDDVSWLPADAGTEWVRSVTGSALTLSNANGDMVCMVTVVDNDNITLTLPTNPNIADLYNRDNNGWLDRYDFIYTVVYTLTRYNN